MTTAQIEHENTQLINDLYRLLKKYLGLRHLIRVLKVSESDENFALYPLIPIRTRRKSTAARRCIRYFLATQC